MRLWGTHGLLTCMAGATLERWGVPNGRLALGGAKTVVVVVAGALLPPGVPGDDWVFVACVCVGAPVCGVVLGVPCVVGLLWCEGGGVTGRGLLFGRGNAGGGLLFGRGNAGGL